MNTPPKRVLCLMDMAPLGRAALAPALQVLAACGVQACGLPLPLLSTHLGGFGAPAELDTAAFCAAALAHYRREEIGFDAVYTGYLMDAAAFRLANEAFDAWPGALKIVDPVLGDGGQPYSRTTPQVIEAMTALAARADLITPNATEAALLCGLAPGALAEPVPLAASARRLAADGRSVLVTSAPLAGGAEGLYCAGAGGEWPLPLRHEAGNWPGTGDLFTAALTGSVLRGIPLHAAAGRAAAFVGRAVRISAAGGAEPRQGVWFEPLLHTLG